MRHPEFDRSFQEQWYYESVLETHIPLIKLFDRLHADRVPFKLTLSVSPTLAAMMEDPLLQHRSLRHIEQSIRLADRELKRTRDQPEIHALAEMYKQLFVEARQLLEERCGMRLIVPLREFAAAGQLELITSTATHGYLPALQSEPGAVRAQVLTAVREHERLFGKKPEGLWLPNCGYYRGLEHILAEAGLRYFFVESYGIENAEPRPPFGVHTPLYCDNGVAAFGRCPTASKLVWSNRAGYLTNPNYREYYRDIGFELDEDYLREFQYEQGVRRQTGIKYLAGSGLPEENRPYSPEQGQATAGQHALDFVLRCHDQLAPVAGRLPFPGVIVAPFNAELFGHWWFEGPQWLNVVLRKVVAQKNEELALSTPSEYLDRNPMRQQGTPAPSHWGAGELWLNSKTNELRRPLYEAAVRMARCVRHVPVLDPRLSEGRALRQAGRELLLAQSSDWPFMIANGTTEEYARRRFDDHLNRFHYLLNHVQSRTVDLDALAAMEYMNALFPELEPESFASPRAGA